jgi:hypothetical protein
MPRTRKEWKVAEGKTCFVASVIGADKSDRRIHADAVLRHIIKPVCKVLKMQTPIRADDISESGNIGNQVVQRIINDDLMIIDMSWLNPNVFYEMALRHCVRKPYVHLMRSTEDIPFDVAPQRTVGFDLTNLDSVEETKRQLLKFIVAALTPGAEIDTPIGQAITFEQMKAGNATEKAVIALSEQVTQLRTDLEQRLPAGHGGASSAVYLEGKISHLMRQLASLTAFESFVLKSRIKASGGDPRLVLLDLSNKEQSLRKFLGRSAQQPPPSPGGVPGVVLGPAEEEAGDEDPEDGSDWVDDDNFEDGAEDDDEGEPPPSSDSRPGSG